jgi:hypothetical protein
MIHTVVTVASCKATGHIMINESTGQVFYLSTHNALLVLKVPRFAKHKKWNLLKTNTSMHSLCTKTYIQAGFGLLFKDMVIRRENAHCFFLDKRQPTVSTIQGSLSKQIDHETPIFLTPLYTILQETGETWQLINRPTLIHVMFLRKSKEKQFFLWTQHFDRRCVCNPTV